MEIMQPLDGLNEAED